MNTLAKALARRIEFTHDTLVVDYQDGRSLHLPLEWFPRLSRASLEARSDWRLIGGGVGVHWPQLDEDLSAGGFLTMTGPLQTVAR